jgi:hypothetical protein
MHLFTIDIDFHLETPTFVNPEKSFWIDLIGSMKFLFI